MKNSSEPLDAWNLATTEIPAAGLERTVSADETARLDLAKALELVALETLTFQFGMKPMGDGRFRLKGTLTARVVQSCVVTLEPVANTISDRVMTEFMPAENMPDEIGGVVDLDDAYDEEPIIDQRLDVGRIVYEHLASALDPYPRKDGANLDWTPKDDVGQEKPNPFAVLAKLKDKK